MNLHTFEHPRIQFNHQKVFTVNTPKNMEQHFTMEDTTLLFFRSIHTHTHRHQQRVVSNVYVFEDCITCQQEIGI